jgi:tetratricopeptide (TPR) repeat protein
MSQSTNHNDGKLLFAITGGIIVIAAGIAILASLGNQDTPVSRDIAAMPAMRTDTVDAVALPASIGSALTDPTESLADQFDDVDPVEPVFVIDPAANFVEEGIAAYESKRYDQARAYFAAEAQERPERAWTHYILALSQWKSGNAVDAADSMRRSLEIDATQVKAFVNLSRIENDRGEFDSALSAADEALVLEPENAEASFLRARSLYNTGDKETALAALETSLDHDSENGYAHNLVGLIWIERGEGGLAADAMEQAAQRIPDVTFVQNNLGMAFELSGRLDEAAVAYARAVELAPSHERAAMNLARLDGRIPEFPEDTVDEEPVVAVLTEIDSTPAEAPAVEAATDESEIPD